MPTLLKGGGFRIVIYPNDHDPPHVHVVGPDKFAKVEIGAATRVVSNIGFGPAEIRRALALVEAHEDELMEAWRHLHG